jgi:hypothetical protein
MVITATKFRSNIYRILDRVLKTGESVGISRNGKIIKIVPPSEPSKFEKLRTIKKMGKINCDPESLVHMDWSGEWKGDL